MRKGDQLQVGHRGRSKEDPYFLFNFTSSLSCCFVRSKTHQLKLENVHIVGKGCFEV